MYVRKMLLLLVVLLCAITASSCMRLEFSTEALMNAPMLAPEQAKIKEALTMHLGVEEAAIQFKYPKEGDYRSAFVMRDINGDGSEEALVFYSLRGSEENKAFVNVLSETESGWVSTCNIGGLSSNVDTVAFAPVMQTGHDNLIVGWSSAGGERMIGVYSYTQEELLEREYKGSYNEMLLWDMNRDGLVNLLLLRSNEVSQASSAVMVAANNRGELKDMTRLELDNTFTRFGKVQIGMLSTSTEAVFIDAYVGDDVVTSIIRYEKTEEGKGRLIDVTGDLPKELQANFRRPEPVFCADIDGDGIIEIPRMTELPGYDGEQYSATFITLYATEYLRVAKSDVTPIWRGFVNTAAGYRFEFPTAWDDEVSAYQESNRVHFFVFRGDLYDTTDELLVLLNGSVNDKNDTTEYHALHAERGIFYAALPTTGSKDMRPTLAQVQKNFSTL